MTRVNDTKWYKWHAYFTLGVVYFFGVLLAGTVLSLALPEGWISAQMVGYAIAGPLLVWAPVAAIGSLIGYYEDAAHLREAEAEYQPIWVLWVLGHLLVGPFVAPLYLLRRRLKVGNDYSDTLIGRLPGMA